MGLVIREEMGYQKGRKTIFCLGFFCWEWKMEGPQLNSLFSKRKWLGSALFFFKVVPFERILLFFFVVVGFVFDFVFVFWFFSCLSYGSST